MTSAQFALSTLLLRLSRSTRHRLHQGGADRGDVPGWVLVTLMTAGLVTVLWALAGPALGGLFTDAVNGVTGPGNP